MRGYKWIILVLMIVNVVACSSIEKTKYHAPGETINFEDSIETNNGKYENRYPVIVKK